eukprot:TRINITY_DN3185_c1_g1_i1.p1 TRINITY_DN3185_c1_g1~~TRINITY_DN3185_c1_g1_i1.p1  ORF type:complete len:757 (+),score=206.70 TRINITY_DN3185_c1_g1_i1:171-2441(+)
MDISSTVTQGSPMGAVRPNVDSIPHTVTSLEDELEIIRSHLTLREEDQPGRYWIEIDVKGLRPGRKGSIEMYVPEAYPAAAPSFTLHDVGERFMDKQLDELYASVKAHVEGKRGKLTVLSTLTNIICSLADVHYGIFKCGINLEDITPRKSAESFSFSNFSYTKVVGKGVHGKVYKCYLKDRSSRTPLAVKRFLFNHKTISQDILREIGTLSKLRDHPYVLRLHGLALNLNDVFLVMGYHPQTLHDIKFHRDLQAIRRVFYQLLTLCSFLEEQGIVHRDWKPANILWDSDSQLIKLADFGQARLYAPTMWHKHIFTLDYRPPEISMGCDTYTFSCDMWCVALVVYFMVVRGPLFDTDDEEHDDEDLLMMIFRELGVPTEASWPGFESLPKYIDMKDMMSKVSKKPRRKLRREIVQSDQDNAEWVALADLLKKMVVCNPAARIRAKDAMRHEFFTPLVEAMYPEEESGEGPEKQLRLMKHADEYQHPLRPDRSPLLTGDVLQRRTRCLEEVLLLFDKHYQLSLDEYLAGVHLFDTFVRDGGMPRPEYRNLIAVSSLFMVHKLIDDHYFDASDSDTASSYSVELEEDSRSSDYDSVSSYESSSEDEDNDDAEEEDEGEEEGAESEKQEGPKRDFEAILEVIGCTLEDVRKTEHMVLEICGLNVLADTTLPNLRLKATRNGLLTGNTPELYNYIALTCVMAPELVGTFTTNQLHAIVMSLVTSNIKSPIQENAINALRSSPIRCLCPADHQERISKITS